MAETRIAWFNHHWQAEMARGYLEDAGIASRLVSDNLAGGFTYMGSIAGASLLVAEARAEEAIRVLEDAGVVGETQEDSLGGPDGGRSGRIEPPPERSLPPVLRAERDDLVERLAAARKEERRHLIWCVLGMSPAALVPFLGLALEGNVALMALLCALVVLVEGWRGVRSGREARQLELALADLEDRS